MVTCMDKKDNIKLPADKAALAKILKFYSE
jgi:hypothetical protein